MVGKTALVTGSSGFLGTYITEELHRKGYFVRQYDLMKPRTLPPKSEFIHASVDDKRLLTEAAESVDVFFHCAAISDIDECSRDPMRALTVNVLGTLNALEACNANGHARFMLASSLYALSTKGSIYKTTKVAAENLVWDFADKSNLSYTILRFGSLYGPGAKDDNAILRLLTQALSNGEIEYWGTGQETREYIHIRDAAKAAILASDDRFSGKAMHISGTEKIKTIDLLEMVNEIMGGKIKIRCSDTAIEGRYLITPYSFADHRVVGEKLMSESYIDLGSGLLETLQHLSAPNNVERDGLTNDLC